MAVACKTVTFFPRTGPQPVLWTCKIDRRRDDFCLTSGLCLGQVSGYTGLILQNSCTNSS
ncbi:hypothetical protein BJY01DRAFT_209579 [Aspergillus pseudoustus]|uniref:Cyanovirin-N domain-containing protein n=1 Tax=Aspergillus pseudoustus TaxID=1810923 RepID=A0ABR4KFY3_9EURO